jgi:glycosyltransferase involved in cell wall biosynthesis
MNPKVTIIIPCYNSEKWIEKCLRSALEQTYQNLEVIFVDNESTDNSVGIATQLSEECPRLMLSSAANIYPNCWDEARTEGFRLMSGDYVLVMGSDDYIEEEFIENCMNVITKAPDKIKALQSPVKGVKADTGIVVNTISHGYRSVAEFKRMVMERCPVNTPTVIYNTQLYRDGLLKTNPEKYGGAADYDLYCSLADNNILIYPVPMWLGFNYRWHKDQATWKVHKEGKNYDRMIQDYWREKWDLNI